MSRVVSRDAEKAPRVLFPPVVRLSCDTCTWPILAEIRDCSQSHCHFYKGGSTFALFDSVVSFLRLNKDYLTNQQNRLVYGRKSSSHWRKRNGFVDHLLVHKDLCLNTILASFKFVVSVTLPPLIPPTILQVLDHWSPKLSHENDGLIFNPAEEVWND